MGVLRVFPRMFIFLKFYKTSQADKYGCLQKLLTVYKKVYCASIKNTTIYGKIFNSRFSIQGLLSYARVQIASQNSTLPYVCFSCQKVKTPASLPWKHQGKLRNVIHFFTSTTVFFSNIKILVARNQSHNLPLPCNLDTSTESTLTETASTVI